MGETQKCLYNKIGSDLWKNTWEYIYYDFEYCWFNLRSIREHIIIHKYYCIDLCRSTGRRSHDITNVWIVGTCRSAIVDGQKKCIWILLYVILLLLWIIILLCALRMGRPVCCCCVSENRGTYLYYIMYALNIPTGGVVSRGINP